MIRDIILMQKKELEQKLYEKYVQRQGIAKIGELNDIQIIIGPRRAGKAFYGMHQLVNNKSFGFISFDDERLAKTMDFDEILEAVLIVYSNPKLLLLDEIQNLPNWELIVTRLQKKGFQLMITGSNSNLLGSKLATHLTGMHIPVHLFTFSFNEFIQSYESELTEIEKKEKFNDFLIQGGYPEPLMKALDRKGYLQVLFDSILFKDIVKRYNIRQPASLENLAIWLISNITAEFSMNSLSRQVQISSVHTIKKYLNYLEESFISFSLSRYSYKIGEQQRSNKKIYCYDNGFYSAKAFHLHENWGKLLENSIASELIRRSKYDGSKLFYWKDRDQEEVDFVIQSGNRVKELIQVCWDTKEPGTGKREVRSLLKASRKLRCKRLTIITYEEEYREEFNWFGIIREVEFVTAWKWMLIGEG